MKKTRLLSVLFIALLLTSFTVSAGENTENAGEVCSEEIQEACSEEIQEACSEGMSEDYDEEIREAMKLVKNAWLIEYVTHMDSMPVPVIDIRNTRIVKVSENPTDIQSGKPLEGLEGIDHIIEFMMLTNYYCDAYPSNVGIMDTVAVYEDGKMEVQKTNLMNSLRARYFIMDLGGVVDEIIDFGGAYNGKV